MVTDEGVILIDTPWDKTQFRPLLDSIEKRHKKKVKLCLVTHFHDDRTAGLDYFRKMGIATYSSYSTKKLCAERGEPQAEFTFKNDTVFTLASHKFETYYPGTGHTSDNIVVWFPAEKILYGGCFVKSTENESLGYIADGDTVVWKSSVLKLMKKYPKPAYVVPGHFKGSKGSKALKHTYTLLTRKDD